MRSIIANAFAQAAKDRGYTIWACAICSNHDHVVGRTNRESAEVIWSNLAAQAQLALRGARLFSESHPVWSHRPCKVFLYIYQDVLGQIHYVNSNPMKEGPPLQYWDFVERCPFA